MSWKRQRGCLRDKPSRKNSQAERPLSGTTQTLSVMMLWSLLATAQGAAVDVWPAYFNNIDPRGGDRAVSDFAAAWFCCCFSWAIPGVLLNAAGVNRSFFYVAKGILSVRKQQIPLRSQLCARGNTRSRQQSGEQSRSTLFGFGIQ